MMKPAEAVGSVPQPGVNPAANQPSTAARSDITPEQLATLRNDPELIEVFRRLSGEKDIPMDQIPDEVIINFAGALHKIGIEALVQQLSGKMNPQTFAAMRARGGN